MVDTRQKRRPGIIVVNNYDSVASASTSCAECPNNKSTAALSSSFEMDNAASQTCCDQPIATSRATAPSAEDGGGGGFSASTGTSSKVPRRSTASASDCGDQSPSTFQTRSWDGASNFRWKSSTTALEAGTGGKVL